MKFLRALLGVSMLIGSALVFFAFFAAPNLQNVLDHGLGSIPS